MPEFIQFMHPGGEHGPDGHGRKQWNLKEHRRKFLRLAGGYVEDATSGEVEDELVCWAEWEPESKVEEIRLRVPGGPRWMHLPYYVRPDSYVRHDQVLQNTDPFVFGDTFLYTLCRQWRSSTGRPTLLRDLSPGSLILFGSSKGGEFVLDTAFVTAHSVRHDFDSWPSVLEGRVSETYTDVTMRPTYQWGKGPELRLYWGATIEKPVNGIFSFVPCLPATVASHGFARPAIYVEAAVNPNLMMGFKATHGLTCAEIKALWGSVSRQVVDQGLALGTHFALPRRRHR